MVNYALQLETYLKEARLGLGHDQLDQAMCGDELRPSQKIEAQTLSGWRNACSSVGRLGNGPQWQLDHG